MMISIIYASLSKRENSGSHQDFNWCAAHCTAPKKAMNKAETEFLTEVVQRFLADEFADEAMLVTRCTSWPP
ncbi:hypothetical protein [Comamonas sp. MYb396]|uniref:hypothetical protein n=1 Tax=Comamonas sp. MYb396 TaxID=2745302 RepID=UPI0030B76D0C